MTRRWLLLCVLASAMALAMAVLAPRTLVIETEAEEPPPAEPPKDEFPFSPRPNRCREIKWRAYSAAVFEEAAKLGKPVAVTLTATWCQKCHEMDEKAFSDERVIKLMNDEYLCVRVDTDKHPEIKDRYLSAQGWPTTAFCASTGDPFDKIWYAEADEFLDRATRAAAHWKKKKDDLLKAIATAYEAPRKRDPSAAAIEEVDAILAGIEKTWAEDGSGWASGSFRFPSPANVELYVWKWRDTGDKRWLERATQGADRMLALQDPVEFGFYRVAMRPDWGDPHFEKLLEVNAGMLGALATLRRATGDEKWDKAASRVVEWMDRVLARPEGGWKASQDAAPEYFKLDRAGREKLDAPHVDPAFYSGLNAQAASAMFAYGTDEARAKALAAIERVFAELWTDAGLAHGGGGGNDLLRDLALLGEACLDAAQATGDGTHVKRARDAASRILKLADSDGGLFDRPPDPKAPGPMKWPMRKSADNGRAAAFLSRLHHVTGEEAYQKAAEAALKAVGGEARRFPAYSAEYALAVAKLRRYPLHIVVVGPKDQLAPMVRAADRFWHPWKTVTVLASEGKTVEHAGLEYPPELAAYACVAQACGPPVKNAEAFDEEVKAFLERNR